MRQRFRDPALEYEFIRREYFSRHYLRYSPVCAIPRRLLHPDCEKAWRTKGERSFYRSHACCKKCNNRLVEHIRGIKNEKLHENWRRRVSQPKLALQMCSECLAVISLAVEEIDVEDFSDPESKEEEEEEEEGEKEEEEEKPA